MQIDVKDVVLDDDWRTIKVPIDQDPTQPWLDHLEFSANGWTVEVKLNPSGKVSAILLGVPESLVDEIWGSIEGKEVGNEAS